MRAAEPASRALPGASMWDDLVALLESLRQRSVLSRSFARRGPDLPGGLPEQIVDTVLNGLRPVSSPSP